MRLGRQPSRRLNPTDRAGVRILLIAEVEGRFQCPISLATTHPIPSLLWTAVCIKLYSKKIPTTQGGVESAAAPSAPLSQYFTALSEYSSSVASWHSSSTFGSTSTLIGSGSHYGFV